MIDSNAALLQSHSLSTRTAGIGWAGSALCGASCPAHVTDSSLSHIGVGATGVDDEGQRSVGRAGAGRPLLALIVLVRATVRRDVVNELCDLVDQCMKLLSVR